ncbi:MAG: ABC transporter ATP-binding protein, partial [Hyphomicrobium sp.]|nr:ABC transporter ATP-binding protein [Hyphomicrobium sp.]
MADEGVHFPCCRHDQDPRRAQVECRGRLSRGGEQALSSRRPASRRQLRGYQGADRPDTERLSLVQRLNIEAVAAGGVAVEIDGVGKRYQGVEAVRAISLSIVPGEFVSLLGPSGCGKTTTLRMIAGLEVPDSGTIRIGGAVVNSTPPWSRGIGMVFQSYALFPHMTVFENIAFGLKMRGEPAQNIKTAVDEAMALVHLSELPDRLPSQLSGGQRQRVA